MDPPERSGSEQTGQNFGQFLVDAIVHDSGNGPCKAPDEL